MAVRPRGEPAYRRSYEDDVGLAVIEAVATVDDSSPTEIGPLNDVLDPEALDDLFGSTHDGRARAGGVIRFVFEGRPIVIDSACREVVVYEQTSFTGD